MISLKPVHTILLIIAMGMLISMVNAQETASDRIIGTWRIDTEKSIDHIKQNPQYGNLDEAKIADFVEQVGKTARLNISDTHVRYGMGAETQSSPYQIVNEGKDTVELALDVNGRPVKLVMTLFEDGAMNYQSSATPDMDHYIWRKE